LPPELLLLALGVALFSACIVALMIRVRVLDTPGLRSAHKHPVPKGGGVGSMAGFLVGSLVALGPAPGMAALAVLAAAVLLAAFAWLDDLRQFSPWLKLAAQLLAAVIVLLACHPLPGPPVLAWGVALLWLVFVTNAVNFIDGLNGLASGAAILFCLILALVAPGAAGAPGSAAALLALMLAAGLLGFLPFNYPRARIFMGDVGSQPVGLVLASLTLLRWQQAGPGGALLPALMLSGLLFDVAFTLCRRALAGARLAEAHRGHLYQVAWRSGIPAWLVSLVEWGFVLWGAGAVLVLADTPWLAVAAALLPQPAWTALVASRAARAGLGRW